MYRATLLVIDSIGVRFHMLVTLNCSQSWRGSSHWLDEQREKPEWKKKKKAKEKKKRRKLCPNWRCCSFLFLSAVNSRRIEGGKGRGPGDRGHPPSSWLLHSQFFAHLWKLKIVCQFFHVNALQRSMVNRSPILQLLFRFCSFRCCYYVPFDGSSPRYTMATTSSSFRTRDPFSSFLFTVFQWSFPTEPQEWNITT